MARRRSCRFVAWGNGDFANSPSGHQNFLSEVASHGFLVIAIGPPPGARGGRGGGMGGGGSTQSKQLLDAIDWAIAQNENKESRYYHKIATDKVAVAGMSCGGLQALEVSTDPRVTTTMVCNSGILNSPMGGGGARGGAAAAPRGTPTPAAGVRCLRLPRQWSLLTTGCLAAWAGDGRAAMPGGARGGMPGGGGGGMAMPAVGKDLLAKLHGPIIYLLGGESDMAFANGSDDYKRIEKLPAVLAYMDVGHGGTYSRPHGGEFARVATAWLKWQLKGDEEAGKMFAGDPCPLSKAEGWTVRRRIFPEVFPSRKTAQGGHRPAQCRGLAAKNRGRCPPYWTVEKRNIA